MEKSSLDSIYRQVYARYPEVSGKRPRPQVYGNDQYLLVFHATASLPNGKKMERTVRVVASAEGRIQKMSSSK
jgi:hypothetical protein